MDNETQEALKDGVRDLTGRCNSAQRRALILAGGGQVDRTAWRQTDASQTAALRMVPKM